MPFNPASSPQKLDLIRHYGLPVPKKRGTDDDTSEAKYLKRFAKKFPVFGTIVECQQREKLITTYMWPTDEAGRVHTTYTFNPSTWRTSSKNVNLSNIPKRNKELAPLFRKTIIAAPGHVLLEIDSSAIEAVLVGFNAGDQDYIRIAKAGIHGFVSSHRMALMDGGRGIDPKLPFAELRRACRKMKKEFPVEYEDAKRGNHAVNYLLSGFGLNDEYPDTFPTVRAGNQFIEFYHALFGGKIKQWQQATVERAHKETYLENHFQYRHYFYSVYQFDKRVNDWRLGDDAKRAVAFVPQSDAAAIQREEQIAIDEIEGLRDWPLLCTYDSLTFEIPVNEVRWASRELHRILTLPYAELGGLTIGAETNIGDNLGEMETLDMEEDGATTNSGNLANPADSDANGISVPQTLSTGPGAGPAQHF